MHGRCRSLHVNVHVCTCDSATQYILIYDFTPQFPVVTDISVFGVEVGCGFCVDQLLSSLANLTTLINTGFSLLPGSGSVELLRQGIVDVQVGLNAYII